MTNEFLIRGSGVPVTPGAHCQTLH